GRAGYREDRAGRRRHEPQRLDPDAPARRQTRGPLGRRVESRLRGAAHSAWSPPPEPRRRDVHRPGRDDTVEQPGPAGGNPRRVLGLYRRAAEPELVLSTIRRGPRERPPR